MSLAAKQFDTAHEPRGVGRDALRFSVEVSGGVVALRSWSDSRANRALEDGVIQQRLKVASMAAEIEAELRCVVTDALRDAVAAVDHPQHALLVVLLARVDRGGRWMPSAAEIGTVLFGSRRFEALVAERTGSDEDVRTSRTIWEWSRQSRSRMTRALAEIDYSPLFEGAAVPAMVTLTLPGEWEVVAPSGRAFKALFFAWRKRFEREWHVPFRAVWKLEFQRRGAPHLHLWMVVPQGQGRSRLSFAQWLSWSWADVVDHPSQRRVHELAGTAVDYVAAGRSSDPKRLAIYFSKHSSPTVDGPKEYQHIVPQPWRNPGCGPGRFWGYYGLKRVRRCAEIDVDDFIAVRRTMRRWSRSQARYGQECSKYAGSVEPRCARVRVQRGLHADGSPRFRTIRRRRQLMRGGGLKGGFVLVNDGVSFAEALATALARARPQPNCDTYHS